MKNKTLKIQVLGSGCPTCKKLFELTKQAVEELGLKIEVEYITDIQKIIEMGVMQSPVLAIDGKPVMAGPIPDVEKIKDLIASGNISDESASPKKSGCTCGGNC